MTSSPSPPFTVVKVGGSLLEWPDLPERLHGFLNEQLGDDTRPLLVVGGGKSVDVLRDLDRIHRLDVTASHLLAIRALDLTSAILAHLLINSFIVENEYELRACWERGVIPILAPWRFLQAQARDSAAELPASWEVTSDSIAAWVAERLGADRLILLKSADLPAGSSRTQAAAAGFVDPHFPIAARDLENVAYRNLRDDVGVIITLSDDE